MFATNHFAELAVSVPSGVMQTYLFVMIALVVAGTVYDVVHKRSRKYFAELLQKSATGDRTVQGGEKLSIAFQTATVDVLTSAEFCNPKRRQAHLLTMYGFVIYLIATVILVLSADGADTSGSALVIALWYVGALMVCVGGYWFWFFIRVDVAAEGHSPLQLVRADLFVLSLLASVTFGIIWAVLQSLGGGVVAWFFLALYLISTTVLFAGIPWSKFAHMFFKPAAAYQKRMAHASGWAMNLPTLTRDDPEQQSRHSMQLLRDAPMDMGLGIKREDPRHY